MYLYIHILQLYPQSGKNKVEQHIPNYTLTDFDFILRKCKCK